MGIEYLMAANDTTDRNENNKSVERAMVSALLEVFEPLQDPDDPLPEIRSSKRPAGIRIVEVPKEADPAVPRIAIAAPGGTKKPGWQQVKQEQGQKRPAPASDSQTAKTALYLPTPVARAGYYGR